MPLFYEKNEPILEETDIKNETHIYKYKKIKDSRDIDKFLKYSREILNDENNMNKETIRNQIKVIYFRNKFIGYIGLVSYVSDKTNKKYLAIRSFMILPQYQGMGHGTNIINNIIEENKTKGYDEIYCWVEKDNINAIKFYQRIADVNNNLFKDKYYYVCLYKKSNINESYIGGSNSGNYHYYHLAKSGNIETFEPTLEKADIKNEIPNFNSDKELSKFMKSNIKYKNFTKLMSAQEVYDQKKGSCHDQVMFELYVLSKLKLRPSALFMIEYNEESGGSDAVTHSLVYYYKNNKLYWFENAWSGKEGIHEFENLSELKKELIKSHNNGDFGNVKKYPKLEICSFKKHKPGETLQQLVDIAVNETYFYEACIGGSNPGNYPYYHLAKSGNIKTLEPRIPDNFMTKHGYENSTTKRVCFTPTIDKCLMAISKGIYEEEYFVYVMDGDYGVYRPTLSEVPDVKITGEVWIKEPVKVKCIGKIKVITDDGKPGKKFKYGNNEEAELFGWNYKWIEKTKQLNEFVSSINEESKIEDDKLPKYIYHISYINHDGETFEPRTYENDNVKNGMERKVKRVCFSDSITRALYSIFPNGAYDADFYVHIPGSDVKVYNTDNDDIYDSDITHELWVKEPVVMKCIGKIHVSGVSKKTHTIEVDKDKAGYGKKKYHESNWKWVEKYEKDTNLYESCINESTKSTISKNYKPKGTKNLSSFKIIHITEKIIDRYKKEYPFLRHVRCKDTKDYICDGYMWLDDNKLVATVGSCEYTDDKTKWIVSLEITKKYRGYCLSKQILDYAVKNMNCKYLSVNKNNEVAKKVYDKYGFKVYEESDTMYYMTIDKNVFKNIKESTDICDSKRESVLNTTEELLKNMGKSPKISKSDREKWINHKQQMFGDSLCIAGLGHDGLSSLCTKVNKEIKPLGGRLSPDNYGTAFLSIKESSIYEEAEYDNKNKYPVYIVAMHSGTPLANIIQKVTDDEFSHACISFNSKLDPLYSFGSKKFGERSLGLVKQNPFVEFYKKYKAHYKVFVTFVDKSSYNSMKERIKWFEENDEKMKYDFLGLIKILFNKDTEKNTYKYFCSRFVSEILGYGKQLSKLPSLYKPQDLVELDIVSLVNGGDDLFKYDFRITEKNLKNVKKRVFDKVVFGESRVLPDNVYSSFHLEPEYRDPKYCCWDEELYYRDLQSAIISLQSSKKEEGEYEVYTDLGCGKTKYIGQITYYHKPDTGEPSYVWNKTINEMSYLLGENAANTAIVGTAGNVFIHNCMKKNTFADTPEDNEYIVSRDGGTDIFRFDKDGKKYKLTREEFTNDYTILKTYKFCQPLFNPIDYFKTVLESTSGYDFYLHLIYNQAPQKDISRDVRFETVTSFFQELDQIKQKVFCEYYKIRNNKSVIDWVDENIQSLLEVSYRADSEKSVNESDLISHSDYVERMIERLKTLQSCLPSIN